MSADQQNGRAGGDDQLRIRSVQHAERALVAAAAAWADVLAAPYAASGRETASRAFRRQLELEFRKAVEQVCESRATGTPDRARHTTAEKGICEATRHPASS